MLVYTLASPTVSPEPTPVPAQVKPPITQVYSRRQHHLVSGPPPVVCEKIQLGLISTGYVKIGEQLSDIFTKALSGERVSYLCNMLCMINIYAPI